MATPSIFRKDKLVIRTENFRTFYRQTDILIIRLGSTNECRSIFHSAHFEKRVICLLKAQIHAIQKVMFENTLGISNCFRSLRCDQRSNLVTRRRRILLSFIAVNETWSVKKIVKILQKVSRNLFLKQRERVVHKNS